MTCFKSRPAARAALAVAVMALSSCGGNEPAPGPQPEQPGPANVPPASPAPAGGAARQAYYGDLHVHSSWSLDAYQLGAIAIPRRWPTASGAARR